GRPIWMNSRRLAGGGSLIQTGYNGLDVLLWLFRQFPADHGGPLAVESVSAECVYEYPPPVKAAHAAARYATQARPADVPWPGGGQADEGEHGTGTDQVESLASLRMRMTNGAVFDFVS